MLLARSVVRVALVVAVSSAGGLVWSDLVGATGKDINATTDPGKCDKQWGPPCFTPANGTVTQVNQGETVTWKSLDGTHTVTPADGAGFAGSEDLVGPDASFSVTFDKPGTYSFYCKHHGSVEDGGKIHHGMWGRIEVKATATTTSAPPGAPPSGDPPPKPDPGPPPPPSTGPAHPSSPPPTGSSPPPSNSNGQTAAGSGKPFVGPPPSSGPPPPTRVASSPAPAPTSPPSKEPPSKDKDKGGGAAAPAEATSVPPDEAVLPPSPQFPTPTTAPLAETPTEIPQGDTVAVIKSEASGHKRRLVLFITFFGVGAFALGVGGWKFMNRSSKYWPA